MFLKGDLLIRLEPLIDELPVIGGIAPCHRNLARTMLGWGQLLGTNSRTVKVACFLNQPELEFHYSGLAARWGHSSRCKHQVDKIDEPSKENGT